MTATQEVWRLGTEAWKQIQNHRNSTDENDQSQSNNSIIQFMVWYLYNNKLHLDKIIC